MAIEVEKIIAATETLTVRLEKYNELERVAMERQSEADAAAARSGEARRVALAAVADLHGLTGEILATTAPPVGPEQILSE